jgi:3-phosphoshikimate 1-carboxyvinyltransferase
MIAEISFSSTNTIRSTIHLPASKSIANRALIIHAIGNLNCAVNNLSEAADTIKLQQLLLHPSAKVHVGDGGTTLRFLLAYYCLKGEEVEINASPSLTKRPVAELVNALREIGGELAYLETEGSLPLKIGKGNLHGGEIFISGEISSQFISAIMMIGPYLPGGIKINITGEMLSLPYILMTKSLMEYYGVTVSFNNTEININEGNYTNSSLTVEPDWSAASYWYQMVALNKNAEVFLPGLLQNSLQGDAVIAEMMLQLGVETQFKVDGVMIRNIKNFKLPDYFTADFSGCPDLGLAVAAVCGALNITADLTGLKNFRLKESDRAAAMQRELYNMGVRTDFCGGSKFKVYTGTGMRLWNKPVKTYHDHRIAMAFAALATKTGTVLIDNFEVVSKSYPHFFDDLKLSGFEVLFVD